MARKLAGEFETVSLTELAIEIAVSLDQLRFDHNLAERSDDKLITTNGAPCQRLHSCPDESVLLILDFQNSR